MGGFQHEFREGKEKGREKDKTSQEGKWARTFPSGEIERWRDEHPYRVNRKEKKEELNSFCTFEKGKTLSIFCGTQKKTERGVLNERNYLLPWRRKREGGLDHPI